MSQFELEKYKLIHFWPRSRAVRKELKGNDLTALLKLEGHTVDSSPLARLLEVILDSRLNWKTHLQGIEVRATVKLMKLVSYTGSVWGIPYEGLRKLYEGIILPTLLFTCSAWYTPLTHEYRIRDEKMNQVLRAIQKQAACIISSEFKNVPGATLDIECHQLLVRQVMEKAIAESALKIQTCSNYDLIRAIQEPIDRQRLPRKTQKLKSPLKLLKKSLKVMIDTEVEKWTLYITSPWWNLSEINIALSEEEVFVCHDRVKKTDH